MSTLISIIFNLFFLAISMPTILYLLSIMRARVNSILSNLCQLLLYLWIPSINVYLCQVLCWYYRYPMCPSLATVSCDSCVSCGHRLVLTCVFLCAKRNRGAGGLCMFGYCYGNPLDTKKRQKYNKRLQKVTLSWVYLCWPKSLIYKGESGYIRVHRRSL